jgi:hypothetical protein
VGDYTLLYTTAEVFTWKKYADRTVLVLYGGPDELHEFAVTAPSAAKISKVEGMSVSSQSRELSTVVQWKTSPNRQFIQVGTLAIYLVGESPQTPTPFSTYTSF